LSQAPLKRAYVNAAEFGGKVYVRWGIAKIGRNGGAQRIHK
jgi:hypothetical protein